MAFVFSSVPVDSLADAKEVNAIKELLAGSPGSFFTARQIAEHVGLPTSGTQVQVRRAIKELQLCHVPIVSHHSGFAMATNRGMVLSCLEREEHRHAGLLRGLQAYRETADLMSGQQELRGFE